MLTCFVGTVLCLTLTAFARAATIHTSLASFTANTQPGLFTNSFTREEGGLDSSLSFSGGGFSYVISSATAVYSSGDVVGASEEADDLVISFTSGNVTAVGGNFFQTDIGNSFLKSMITVNLADGTTLTRTPADVNDYVGFTSLSPITSLTLKSNGEVQTFVTLDNLSVGRAVVVVPEGGTVTLAVVALPLLLTGVSVCRSKR